MSKIILHDVSKKYTGKSILKNIHLELSLGEGYIAFVGENGSGKSTMLKIISGIIQPDKGEIKYFNVNNEAINTYELYENIAFVAPYIQTYEWLNIKESIDFHFSFKRLHSAIKKKDILSLLQLTDHIDKPVHYFSSGMKQKMRLGFALFSDTPFLFLDEPLSNLDEKNSEWFFENLKAFSNNRLVIFASNNEKELIHCKKHFKIKDFR